MRILEYNIDNLLCQVSVITTLSTPDSRPAAGGLYLSCYKNNENRD
jgi:hypothetical protein